MPFLANLNFSKRQWLTLLIIGLADFCNAICVSLQAPFFPHEAEKKGCTATEYGLVFGIFELVVFIISPIYGQYLNRIGPKVLFNGGIFTTGTSAILFGLLDRVNDHTAFITLAFVIRIIEALGNAAFLTASFAIIAKEFPNNVGTTFASLETFFGLGLIVGPMVGGALYTLGGYFLPFVILGFSLFLTAIITLCVLPRHPKENDNRDPGPSIKSVLRIPGVMVCSIGICATSASIGFLSATLEPHLRQFNLSPVLLGMIFVINGGIYALTAPIWGWMVDKCINPKLSSLLGTVFIAVGFATVGPVWFIPVETKISNVILGLVFHGIGISALLVSSFTDALRSSIKKGLPDSIETYGLISGLWTSTFALGAFIGPSVSGALYDSIGFRKATFFIVALHGIVGVIITIFLCLDRSPNPYKELISNEPLSRNNKRDRSVNSCINNNNNTKNGILFAHENNNLNEQARNGAMPNLMVSNSYTNSKTQWTRSRDNVSSVSSLPIGAAPTGAYYGSVDCIRSNIPRMSLQETFA